MRRYQFAPERDFLSFAVPTIRGEVKKYFRHYALDDRERRMVEMRFFGNATQAQIGKEPGLTQMQVSRLVSGLMARLREMLSDCDAPLQEG